LENGDHRAGAAKCSSQQAAAAAGMMRGTAFRPSSAEEAHMWATYNGRSYGQQQQQQQQQHRGRSESEGPSLSMDVGIDGLAPHDDAVYNKVRPLPEQILPKRKRFLFLTKSAPSPPAHAKDPLCHRHP
jgi:hypothetical protein